MTEKKAYVSNAASPRLRLIKYLHLFLSVLLFFVFWLWFRFPGGLPTIDRGFRYNYFVALAYAALLMWFNGVFNSYTLGYFRIRALAFSQFLADFFSITITYLAVSLAWFSLWNPLPFLPLLVTQVILNCVWSYYATKYYYKIVRQYRTVVLYRNERDLHRFGDISGQPVERLFRVETFIRCDGVDFETLREQLRGYDAIFVTGADSSLTNALSTYCIQEDVRGFFLPPVGSILMSGARHIKSFSSPVLSVRRAMIPMEYRFVKRCFDIFFSLIFLILTSPIMIFTALAIKLYDGGPVFYRQVRLTQDRRRFSIIKFRSMRVDAEKDGVARLSTGEDDPRITPVGRFIRSCRVDELPQLFNILSGDMSIVGPRPERPEIAEQYERILPEFALRLQVKAGLTGYAQVYGKYNTSPYEKLEFDLLYINQMNVLTDLELMFNTFRILFYKDSTEGFDSQMPWLAEEKEPSEEEELPV